MNRMYSEIIKNSKSDYDIKIEYNSAQFDPNQTEPWPNLI